MINERYNETFFSKLSSQMQLQGVSIQKINLDEIIEALKQNAEEIGPFSTMFESMLALESAGNRGENVKTTTINGVTLYSFLSRYGMVDSLKKRNHSRASFKSDEPSANAQPNAE